MPVKDFSPKDWMITIIVVAVAVLLISAVDIPMITGHLEFNEERMAIIAGLMAALIAIVTKYLTMDK